MRCSGFLIFSAHHLSSCPGAPVGRPFPPAAPCTCPPIRCRFSVQATPWKVSLPSRPSCRPSSSPTCGRSRNSRCRPPSRQNIWVSSPWGSQSGQITAVGSAWFHLSACLSIGICFLPFFYFPSFGHDCPYYLWHVTAFQSTCHMMCVLFCCFSSPIALFGHMRDYPVNGGCSLPRGHADAEPSGLHRAHPV